jgi:hypothetical protein
MPSGGFEVTLLYYFYAILDFCEVGRLAWSGDFVQDGLALGERRCDARALAAVSDGHDSGRRRRVVDGRLGRAVCAGEQSRSASRF